MNEFDTLTDEQLKDKILWAKIDAIAIEIEPRYENQPYNERTWEYKQLHKIYQKYWDEAVRRKLVNF